MRVMGLAGQLLEPMMMRSVGPRYVLANLSSSRPFSKAAGTERSDRHSAASDICHRLDDRCTLCGGEQAYTWTKAVRQLLEYCRLATVLKLKAAPAWS